jgi:hypothetical protein
VFLLLFCVSSPPPPNTTTLLGAVPRGIMYRLVVALGPA